MYPGFKKNSSIIFSRQNKVLVDIAILIFHDTLSVLVLYLMWYLLQDILAEPFILNARLR
jgi:hypothetical protein